MSTPADEPVWLPDQYDEIAWGASEIGNVPAGGRDDYADRAGLPRLPVPTDGLEHLHTAHDAAKCWHPPREASEHDPARAGTPPPGFRASMAPVSDPRVRYTRQPRGGRTPTNWQP